VVKNHVEATKLGKIPLTALTRDDVRRWVKQHEGKASPKSIANYRGLLSAALGEAVLSGRIASNPCAGIRLPRRDDQTREEHVFLTRAQVERLAKALPKPVQFVPRVLARTGLRWGELTALQVGDVALGAKPPTLTVARARMRGEDGGYIIGPPKTRRSRRTIALDAVTVRELRPHVVGHDPRDFVLSLPNGEPVPHSTFAVMWREALFGNGTPEKPGLVAEGVVARAPRVHDLRHTHAAWLISAGVPLPAIQRRLGHESITTTIDTYGHLLREVDDQVLAALDAAI
jgi:integrase